MALRRSTCFLLLIRVVKVYEETVSLRTRELVGSFKLVKLVLQFLKGVLVVLKEPAFALRRKSRANVEDSLDFATCTIVFRSEMEGWNT